MAIDPHGPKKTNITNLSKGQSKKAMTVGHKAFTYDDEHYSDPSPRLTLQKCQTLGIRQQVMFLLTQMYSTFDGSEHRNEEWRKGRAYFSRKGENYGYMLLPDDTKRTQN